VILIIFARGLPLTGCCALEGRISVFASSSEEIGAWRFFCGRWRRSLSDMLGDLVSGCDSKLFLIYNQPNQANRLIEFTSATSDAIEYIYFVGGGPQSGRCSAIFGGVGMVGPIGPDRLFLRSRG
jgi:hypothetical protein